MSRTADMSFEVPAQREAVKGGISDDSYILVGQSDDNNVKLADLLSQEYMDILWVQTDMGLPYTTVRYNVVFMGDSITQYRISANRGNPTFFTDNDWYNRGVSGNTSADMLARFNYDLEHRYLDSSP